jgi:hypothetical protein
VYCPRCGTPNEPDDRFCSACGVALRTSGSKEAESGTRKWLDRWIGTTKRARWISGATALALIVAIVSFFALKTDDEGEPDAYTLAAEQICFDAKRQIFLAGQRSRMRPEGASAFAHTLLPAISEWRLRMGNLAAPADRRAEAAQLESALREVEVRVAELARTAGAPSRKRTLAAAARADRASTGVEEAVAALGLDECAAVKLGVVPE